MASCVCETAASTSRIRSNAARRIFSSSPGALRLRDDRGEIALQVWIRVAALEQIAVPDDRLQRAVDLGGYRYRQVRHRLHRPVPPKRELQLLRDDSDREQLRNRLDRRGLPLMEGLRRARIEIQPADHASFRQERHDQS